MDRNRNMAASTRWNYINFSWRCKRSRANSWLISAACWVTVLWKVTDHSSHCQLWSAFAAETLSQCNVQPVLLHVRPRPALMLIWELDGDSLTACVNTVFTPFLLLCPNMTWTWIWKTVTVHIVFTCYSLMQIIHIIQLLSLAALSETADFCHHNWSANDLL